MKQNIILISAVVAIAVIMLLNIHVLFSLKGQVQELNGKVSSLQGDLAKLSGPEEGIAKKINDYTLAVAEKLYTALGGK